MYSNDHKYGTDNPHLVGTPNMILFYISQKRKIQNCCEGSGYFRAGHYAGCGSDNKTARTGDANGRIKTGIG